MIPERIFFLLGIRNYWIFIAVSKSFYRIYYIYYTICLFNKLYVRIDILLCFFLLFIEGNLVLLKEVSALCVDGYDKRTKFLYLAAPECLRHSKLIPVMLCNTLNLS